MDAPSLTPANGREILYNAYSNRTADGGSFNSAIKTVERIAEHFHQGANLGNMGGFEYDYTNHCFKSIDSYFSESYGPQYDYAKAMRDNMVHRIEVFVDTLFGEESDEAKSVKTYLLEKNLNGKFYEIFNKLRDGNFLSAEEKQ